MNNQLAARLAQALMTSLPDQRGWTFATVYEKILAVLDSALAEEGEALQKLLDEREPGEIQLENTTLRELYAKPRLEGKDEPG